MSYNKYMLTGSAIALSQIVASPALAQSSDLGVEILQMLVDEGVIPFDKAQTLLDEARRREALKAEEEAAAEAETTINVPYIPEVLKDSIKEDIEADVIETAKQEGWVAPNSLPEWVKAVRISGDMRARYQKEEMPKEGNFPSFPDVAEINRQGGVTDADGFPLLNSVKDRLRPNYRARIKFEADVNKFTEMGIRLATGDDESPISTNSTFGEYFNKENIWVDQAYIKVQPIEELGVVAGRMPNPFFSTNMVWDTDINPEGFALVGEYDVFDNLSVFGAGGFFPLQERALYPDTNLYAAQIGLSAEFTDVFSYKTAFSYYSFENLQSVKNPEGGSQVNDWSAPKYLSKGNSIFNMRTDGVTTLAGLASEFELGAVIAEFAYKPNDLEFKLTGEAVENFAMDVEDIADLRAESGVKPGNFGWHVRVDAGHPIVEKFGQWKVSAGYRHVETDAVLDVFTDSDFGLGGTDQEGYILRGDVGIYDNTALGVAVLSSDSINRAPFSTDIYQVNLNVKF